MARQARSNRARSKPNRGLAIAFLIGLTAILLFAPGCMFAAGAAAGAGVGYAAGHEQGEGGD